MKFSYVLTLALLAGVAAGQQPAKAVGQDSPTAGSRQPEAVYVLRCGTLIDGKSGTAQKDVAVTVSGNKIESVKPWNPAEGGRATRHIIDLSQMTCLPGLIDTHTHIVLQGDIIVSYDEQLLKDSDAYRAIRAVAAAKNALNFGFTAMRDLETEGAGYTDVEVRNAINRGIIPGPRFQVATRSLNVTGAYALLGYNWERDWPHGVQVCDGPDECRVRGARRDRARRRLDQGLCRPAYLS